MKPILLLCSLLTALSVTAANVHIPLSDFVSGSTLTNAVKVTQIGGITVSGSYLVTGWPRRFATTNGETTVALLASNYKLEIDGITLATNFLFRVPTDATTNVYEIADLRVDGGNYFRSLITQTNNYFITTNVTTYETNLMSSDTNYVFAVGDTNSVFFWVDWSGIAHADMSGGTNLSAPNLVGEVPLASIPTLSSNNLDAATDAAYRATAVDASLIPTNQDTRTFEMTGPWTFSGGITAPGLAGFSLTASNATSGATPTPIWTNSVTTNTTIKLGNISITGTGPTNSLGSSVLNAVFRRGAGSVEFGGSNVLESASGGMTAVFTTNGTADQVVLVVTGHADENANWYAQGFYKVLTNGLPSAPVISAVASSVTPSNATVTWTTDVPANSTVSYGLTSSYGSTSNTSDLVTSHSVTVGGLSEATTYYYLVSSTNALGLSDAEGDYTLTTSTGIDADQLYTNLVAYWNLDEASGTRYPQVGSGISLGESGATIYSTTGIHGSAANNFLGVSSFLNKADNAAMSFTNGSSWTIQAWVKANSSNIHQAVINKTDSGAYEYFLRGYTNGHWQFAVYTNLTSSSSAVTVDGPPIVTNAWQLLVAWQDASAGTLNLQVDGGTVYSTNMMGGINDGTGTFRIGRNSSTAYFDGAIDEVAIWKTALSSGLRGLLWTSGTGAFYPY